MPKLIDEKIAIVGLSFRFPGDLRNEEDLWRALLDGADVVTQVDSSRWATDVLRHGKRSEPGRSVTFSAGVLSRIDEFDAAFFGISPREAAWMDPQQRLLLELAWEMLENAGMPASRLAGSDCAVYVGISGFDYGVRSLDDLASLSAHTMTGNTLSIAANRLSYVFDLHGPSMAIDTACSSSLVALHQACNALRVGDASLAMVGGVNVLTHPYPFIGFSKAAMLSERGRCHPFDVSGDGYVRSEGGAVLLLKPLARALSDGDRVLGVILASGANADGARKAGLTIPSVEGQESLMRQVLGRAGIAAEDVDYLEAHGTGTAIGDPVEVAAIGAVYGRSRSAGQPLPIGSIKSNMGHLEPASGMAGLVKALLMLKHRQIPPSINLRQLNPKIDFPACNVQPATSIHSLGQADGPAPVIAINSFGFGGANAHLLLQGSPALPENEGARNDGHLPPFQFSARSQAALRALAGRYADRLESAAPSEYYDLAYAATYRRERLDQRVIADCQSLTVLCERLRQFAAGHAVDAMVSEDTTVPPGKVAFVYAGNGAQWVGMGQMLLAESPAFRGVLEDIDRRFARWVDFSLLVELGRASTDSRMAETEVAQPLLFALQVALTMFLRDQGISPDAVVGHSVGEVAAAWAAGALSLDEAVQVICLRSAAQGLTRGGGRMAVVGMAEADLRAFLHQSGCADLEIAGINSPTNLTLSGPLVELEKLGRAVRERGVVFRLLDLDYAFHSRNMDSIRVTLADSLAGFSPEHRRQVDFVSSVTGDLFDGALDASYWWDNVRQPVLFARAVNRLIDLGCRTFVEISPHAILLRYVRDCLGAAGVKGRVLPSLQRNHDGLDRLQELAWRLHLLVPGDSLRGFFPTVGRFVEMPVYPWQRERHWMPSTNEGYRLIERRRIHPLLGWPLKDAREAWENILDCRSQKWLADHRVGGTVVLPGAAYAEMALAAAREMFGGDTQELEELDILAPMVFDGEQARTTRLDFNPRDGAFRISSRQRLSDDEWILNASGRLLGAVAGRAPGVETPLPASSVACLDRERHYALAAMLGLDYGGLFRGLSKVCLNGRELAGELAAVADLGPVEAGWIVHPAVFDICFQSLLDFFRTEIEAGQALPLLPVKLGRIRLFGPAPAVRFRARLLTCGLRSVLAEFDLFAADGRKVAELTDCRFRAATLQAGRPGDPACWAIRPRLQPGRSAAGSCDLPAVRNLVQYLQEWFVDQESSLRRAVYFGEAQPLFDALVSAFVYQAMQAALAGDDGALQACLDGAPAPTDAQSRLLGWARDLLADQGYLARSETDWRIVAGDMPSAAEIWRTLLAEYPEVMPELLLVGRMGLALEAMLCGRSEPARTLADIRNSHLSDTLFDQSITYRGGRLALEQLLAVSSRRQPPGRRLRVLEISAGVSEIPRQIGRLLDTARLDYVLAHPSADRCDQMRREYQEDRWLTVAQFDDASFGLRTDDPLPCCFDVLILRHCLGRQAAPRAMLAWSHGQLAPGGLLVLAERYADLASELGGGGCPPVAPEVWQDELQQLAFGEIEICHEPAGEGSSVGAYLLLAKRDVAGPAEPLPEVMRWALVVADVGDVALAQQLQQHLVGSGQLVVCAQAAGPLDNRATAADFLRDLGDELDGAIDHLLFMPALRAADDLQPSVALLSLAQAAVALPIAPRLVVLTRGGVPVDGLVAAGVGHPELAATWGLGRVLMNEHPELACTLIDLAFPAMTPDSCGLLAEELLYPDGESEIVFTPAGRHALRLESIEPPVVHAGSAASGRFRLDFLVPGQLRNLLWLEQAARELEPDEIEVRPVATGLNFRDVMYVMGLLPDEAVENGFAGASLGLEFSGVVVRTGARVDEYAPGDAVMGFGSACFSSHVITRVNAVTPKPEAWSFVAAATVPTAFLTVYYALRQLANLRPGERVLIHGAAGGVGNAAIQLARHMGAEVFATAGSDEKREFVTLLGADHVFDSRSLAFAEQILTATDGQGVDVVLNSLAGEAIRRNLHVLRPFGRFLELGKRDFFENTPIGLRPFKDNISYFGIDADQLLIARPELAGRLFREVMALFRSGALSPLPVRAFPAEQVVDAFRYMQQARQIGKVVVSFEGAKITPQPIAARPAETRFDPAGAYLVTGGISGFGLETARWLARHGAGQLVLLGRRGADTPGCGEAADSLRSLGCEVIVLACDVAEPESLAEVLRHQGLRPLKGIFHAAMVLDDALIGQLDATRMCRVLEPKIKGAWNLHAQTRHLSLDHFVLYSSVTTLIGNPGQGNYVAANAWLEALAELRRAQGLPATCIAWGPIGDAGYLTRHQGVKNSLANRLGADPLQAENALRMLGRALRDGTAGNLALADFQWSALRRLLPSAQGPRFSDLSRGGNAAGNAEMLDDFGSMIEGKNGDEIQALVSQLVTGEVAQILAISPERIDPRRSLHDMGLDSLMGVELALGLEKRFAIQISAMMLNEGPTVERVTARIIERLSSTEAGSGDADDLGTKVVNLVAQHGESVSPEILAATVMDIEQGHTDE